MSDADSTAPVEYREVHVSPKYRVGSDGSIWKHKGGDWVPKATFVKDGYLNVTLYADGKRRNYKLHRLILATFKGASDSHTRHLDGNRQNNRPGNLEYGTPVENALDKRDHGTIASGDRCGKTILPDSVLPDLLKLKGTMSQRAAAKKFGVSQCHVSRLWSGKRRARRQ